MMKFVGKIALEKNELVLSPRMGVKSALKVTNNQC